MSHIRPTRIETELRRALNKSRKEAGRLGEKLHTRNLEVEALRLKLKTSTTVRTDEEISAKFKHMDQAREKTLEIAKTQIDDLLSTVGFRDKEIRGKNDEIDLLKKSIKSLHEMNENQAAQLRAVNRLHKRSTSGQKACFHCGLAWPCPTQNVMTAFTGPATSFEDAWSKATDSVGNGNGSSKIELPAVLEQFTSLINQVFGTVTKEKK